MAPPVAHGRELGVRDSVETRLLQLGCRPPLRGPRPTDYRRPGSGPGLSTAEIDALLAWVRDERR